jgi:hypothetical protein
MKLLRRKREGGRERGRHFFSSSLSSPLLFHPFILKKPLIRRYWQFGSISGN